MKIKTTNEVREPIDNMSLNEYRGSPKRIFQTRYKDIFHLYCIIYQQKQNLGPKFLET